MVLTANQTLPEPTPRGRRPHVVQAAQRLLSVLCSVDRITTSELQREAQLTARELRWATKYLRDFGFPVAVTRTGRASTYWLEERTEGMQFVADRYLRDALSTLTSWYHATYRTGDRDHTDLRGRVFEACLGMGRHLGKAPEQVIMELTGPLPVDDELEHIWAEEADRAFAKEIWDSP